MPTQVHQQCARVAAAQVIGLVIIGLCGQAIAVDEDHRHRGVLLANFIPGDA